MQVYQEDPIIDGMAVEIFGHGTARYVIYHSKSIALILTSLMSLITGLHISHRTEQRLVHNRLVMVASFFTLPLIMPHLCITVLYLQAYIAYAPKAV